ncbi:MAG TPA: carbohydrate ABC transporter permease [Lachnospiraceae bacterium]|nr:carbohydrate ABC transporter permease [Lachnospiraceae bacterium]
MTKFMKITTLKKKITSLLKFSIIIGISYVILSPLIIVITNSFFTVNDLYNPVVIMIPMEGTLDKYITSFARMNYTKTMWNTMIYVISLTVIQLFVCSMAGYGFARFKFPFKKLLFGCVILTIVIPTHTIMLPLYMTFRNFDFLGIISLIHGAPINILATRTPMYIMTALGVGLRSGLYIYIFNQFFRGLPTEIEEAAFVDGAGPWYTYFRIMLRNAMPSVLTVTVFSIVWQYNDTFYAKLFSINSNYLISLKISSLGAAIGFLDLIKDTSLTQIYVYAGVILTILPVLIIYVALQKYFIEGVERSGIVG